MIFTVTFSPTLDYTLRLKQLELGQVNRTEEETLYPGGKGINVSLVLHHLGMETTALGFSRWLYRAGDPTPFGRSRMP